MQENEATGQSEQPAENRSGQTFNGRSPRQRCRSSRTGAREGEASPCRCPTEQRKGGASPAYIYALGRIEPRFPSFAAEKEFAQATGRAELAGLSDRQALQAVLAERQNRYLVRQVVLGADDRGTRHLHPDAA